MFMMLMMRAGLFRNVLPVLLRLCFYCPTPVCSCLSVCLFGWMSQLAVQCNITDESDRPELALTERGGRMRPAGEKNCSPKKAIISDYCTGVSET